VSTRDDLGTRIGDFRRVHLPTVGPFEGGCPTLSDFSRSARQTWSEYAGLDPDLAAAMGRSGGEPVDAYVVSYSRTEDLFVAARWYLKTPTSGVMDLTTFSSGQPERLAWMSGYTPSLAGNPRWRHIKNPYRGLVKDGYPFHEKTPGNFWLDGHEWSVDDMPDGAGDELRSQVSEAARRFLERIRRSSE